MPFHAKVLTAMLVVNALLAVIPLAQSQDTMTIIRAVIPALLLYGFLRGSEGVRVLLLIGAFAGVVIGGFATINGIALLSAGALGFLAFVLAVWSVLANGYMLYALRNADVEQWMLRRSLGMDDAA
jgi:hypothetical protein